MTLSKTPFKRKQRVPKNVVRVPRPMPDLHPERPQPHIPIPGVPTPGGQDELYKCQICGAVFKSEEELRLHMVTEHPEKRN